MSYARGSACDNAERADSVGATVSGDRRALMTTSVLMTTYVGETAANLRTSLESIYRQTMAPDEVVLVVDGPIDADQDGVLAAFSDDRRIKRLKIVRLPRNVGLAAALNEGISHCEGDLIMRMDSDDVSLPDRLELQQHYLECHRDIDVVGSWSIEFSDDAPSRMKTSPVSHHAVSKGLLWRDILVHPSLLIRAKALKGVGGYRSDYGKIEDYDLYLRLLQAGARFHVLPKVTVHVRAGAAMTNRRGGLAYCLLELKFRYDFYRAGVLRCHQFLVPGALYAVLRLLPGSSRNWLYRLVRIGARGTETGGQPARGAPS